MKQHLNTAFGILALLILTGCSTNISTDKNAPTSPVSATVRLHETQAAYWASAQGGKGDITFKGETHEFSIRGVGAGGTGLQQITATGKVYNLQKLSDFSGFYTGFRSGLTIIKGKMTAKLTNGNGVILYLTGETTGLASSIGADKFEIRLVNP